MTLHYLDKASSSDDIYSFLDDIVKEWFTTKFPHGFTPPQLYAIPSIHDQQNTLIFSSTGSGKTFAAFLASINELFIQAKKGTLEDKIYVLYISPLKALGNDIQKNLEEPLQGIQDLAAAHNLTTPKIRVGVRTGDTSQAERTKMLKTPPHILITTPESLGLIMASPKFSAHLKSVRWLILDEIHEISNNKRGALLSLSLEYVQAYLAEEEFTRIGLSATQAPIEEIARFLVGVDEEGKERDCSIANLPSYRRFDLKTISPVRDLLHTPYVEIQQNIFSILSDLVLDHETSIVFTNTRKGAESVAFRLKEFLGPDYSSKIAVHHSSLSKEIRLDVEDKLKNNELLAAITSTSLELGIDIGSVELVAQIGSPKSVAKFLQRVGRSGHSLDKIAKGRLLVTDRDDGIECSVLNKAAYAHDLDKVQIPLNCLDVLSQFIVGISITQRWNIKEAYDLIKQSYNFRDLSYDDYINVIEYLGGYNLDIEERKVYRKIWYDEKEKAFGRKRNSRVIYFTNIGTIPESADYFVELETYRTRLGVLSEKFVEFMKPGDIIVLGSHTYQFKRTVGTRVVVSEAFGKRPTVPSWVGEELPRSFELSQQIGRFIKVVADKVEKEEEQQVVDWIITSFNTDEVIAQTIVAYIQEQMLFLNTAPSHDSILVESFIDPQGRMNIVFHSYCGRRVNDALSRAYAYAIGHSLQADIASAVNDNGFLLVLPAGKVFDVNLIPSLIAVDNVEATVKKAIINTELFQTRFRHVANRALMILRNARGKRIPVSRQRLNAKRIFATIKSQEDFCIIKETYREIMRDYMDLANTIKVIERLESGEMHFSITQLLDIPSPFAHGIVLLGSADVVQIADRSALLRELHQMVLSKVFGKDEAKETLFSKMLVDRVFDMRSFKDSDLPISSLRHLRKAVKALSPIRTIASIPPSIYHHSIADSDKLRKWILELHNKKEIVEIPVAPQDYRTVSIVDFPLFWNIYTISPELNTEEERLLKLVQEKGPLSLADMSSELQDSEQVLKLRVAKLERSFLIMRTEFSLFRGRIIWKYDTIEHIIPESILEQAKRLDPEECLKKVLLVYLKTRGPTTLNQLLDDLQIEKDKISRALVELGRRSQVLKGHITEKSSDVQYIRLEDRELLRNLSNRDKDSPVFTYEEINFIHFYYMIQKYESTPLSGKEGMLQVLNDFGLIENLHSLTVRTQDFEIDDLRELATNSQIIQGRFSHRRVAYVSLEMFPYYYVVFKENFELSPVEEQILNIIKKYGPMTKRELGDYTGLDSDVIQESLSILDKTLYLCRKSLSREENMSRRFIPNVYDISSRYVDVNKLPRYEKSQEILLINLIKALGPATLLELTHVSGFKYGDVEKTIKSLLSSEKIVEKQLSETKTNYYLTPQRYDEICEMKQQLISSMFEKSGQVLIIPKEDPFAKLGLRLHLRDVYGEGYVDPILVDGKVVGSVEYKVYPGRYLQVYDLKIAEDTIYDLTLLQNIAGELVNYARSIHRVLSLQIEDINGKSVLSKSNKIITDTFVKTGYRLIKDTLVGGETITRVFPRKLTTRFVLDKLFLGQANPPLSVDSLLKIINHFGQIKFAELISRFPNEMTSVIVFMLNKLLGEHSIVYQNGTFYSLEFTNFRKQGLRRRRKLNEKHEHLLKLIKKGAISYNSLSERVKSTLTKMKSLLSTLEDNTDISANKIASNGDIIEYRAVSDDFQRKDITLSLARQEYIYRIVNSIGLATEDQITELASIPGVLTKVRIKEVLTILVDSERILAGRFVENSLPLYYISKLNYDLLLDYEKEYENVLHYDSDGQKGQFFILPPKDIAQIVLNETFPPQFEVTVDNYCILLNQRLAAQCILGGTKQKRIEITNLILSSWVNSESFYNYIVNSVEALPNFIQEELHGIVIKRINGFSTSSLVK